MSKIIFLSISCLLAISYYQTNIDWVTPMQHDFGDITHGQPVTFEFQFKNSGEGAFVVDNVRTSCGCTIPDWPATPIEPDSTGIISVEYDAKDPGYFKKTIKVYISSQRKAEKLYIEGYVEE